MKEIIQKMLGISEELENSDIFEQLYRLLESLEYKHYHLTFMGQFSAGKSLLINRLLEKDILPVHITETTALITLIQYGDTDRVDILHKDGSQETISIEESQELWQSGNTEQLSEIAQIQIYVNSELLKSGLVIADTPGINTIINNHVELTVSVIENADCIVYVLGKSVTETDNTFIESICASGIPIIFVRTPLDEIKSTEESIELTCEKDRAILKPFTENPVFFVSNEKENFWYKNIQKLQNYLSNNITENLEEALRKNVSLRVKFLANHLKKILEEHSQTLDKFMTGKESDFLLQKKEIEDTLQRMKKILEKNKETLQKKCQDIHKPANEELYETQNAEVKKTRDAISKMKFGVSPERYIQPVESQLKTSCQRIYMHYLATFEDVIKENNQTLLHELSDCDVFSQIDVILPETLQETCEISEDMAIRVEVLQKQQKNLQEEFSSIGERQLEFEGDKEKLMQEEALQCIENELDSYPEYIPKYYQEEASGENEEKFKRIGRILDFATLLIPGATWAKWGAKTLQFASKGAKAFKAVNTAEKLAHTAEVLEKSVEVAKYAKKADNVVDTGRVFAKYVRQSKRGNRKMAQEAVDLYKKGQQANDIVSTVRNQVEESEPVGLLDLLSFEHHLGKVGKKLNKPSTVKIDTEYEQEYYAGKRKIEQCRAEKAKEEIEKRMRIIDIKDKQAALQIREQAIKRNQQMAENELIELQAEIQKKCESSKLQYIISYYQNVAEEKIRAFIEYIEANVQPEMEKKINEYLNTYDFHILTDIHRKEMEFANLEKEFYNMDRKKQEETAKRYHIYLSFLMQFTLEGES